MNSVLIVLPILTVLMFDLGLILKAGDFSLLVRRPKAVIAGLAGQLLFLPLLAFSLALVFRLDSIFFIGIILIACCPGGSSSNVFSMIAKGDVALSVSLTALSSVLTLISIPLIMSFVTSYVQVGADVAVNLPVGKLVVQNILLTLVPVIIGILINSRFPATAAKIHKVLSKAAFPLLILLATVFFIGHYETILTNFTQLGGCITALILSAMLGSVLLSLCFKLDRKEQKTIVIEVGMQNAAQAIAIASSPFVFNNTVMAVPAIIYALMMNVILLLYISIKKNR